MDAAVYRNAATDVGNVKIDDVTLSVKAGGVQLWEDGPLWAESNVGALRPEEYGYYFYFGDTVGYTRSGGVLDSSGNYTNVTWVSSGGEQMSSSPFTSVICQTYGKDNSTLLLSGYIDSTGNLMAKYDAATVHLGSPWRMPTTAEFSDLLSNCKITWTTRNGVYGQLVTGKGDYAAKSIFLPAAGLGTESNLQTPGSYGDYWSSTPNSDDSKVAWRLYFTSDKLNQSGYYHRRYTGLSVRAVQ